jgi:hypothetical protein
MKKEPRGQRIQVRENITVLHDGTISHLTTRDFESQTFFVLEILESLPRKEPDPSILVIEHMFYPTTPHRQISRDTFPRDITAFQRWLARLMISAGRSRSQAEMDNFRDRIIEDYASKTEYQQTQMFPDTPLTRSAAFDSSTRARPNSESKPPSQLRGWRSLP